MEETFISAIHDKRKAIITYFSKKDNKSVSRKCAPLDIGRHAKYPEKGDYFFFWDYDGADRPHPVPKKREDIINFELLSEEFDPGEFVTWEPDWTVSRDWGEYS